MKKKQEKHVSIRFCFQSKFDGVVFGFFPFPRGQKLFLQTEETKRERFFTWKLSGRCCCCNKFLYLISFSDVFTIIIITIIIIIKKSNVTPFFN